MKGTEKLEYMIATMRTLKGFRVRDRLRGIERVKQKRKDDSRRGFYSEVHFDVKPKIDGKPKNNGKSKIDGNAKIDGNLMPDKTLDSLGLLPIALLNLETESSSERDEEESRFNMRTGSIYSTNAELGSISEARIRHRDLKRKVYAHES